MATHTIKIVYTAPVAPKINTVASICDTFVPGGCAADMTAFDGTYYDTNVAGFGEATTIEAFMQKMIAFPGLNAAFRKAMRDGQASYTEASDQAMLIMEEARAAMKVQGFEITVDAQTPSVTPAG